MLAYTDSVSYARKILSTDTQWSSSAPEFHDRGLDNLASQIYASDKITYGASIPDEFWRYLFAAEHMSVSQFDVVVDLCRQNIELPDGLLCSAGAGDLLHGQRDRPWVALPGNIHLTAHFAPHRSAAEVGMGFSLLAAVSMIETIDRIAGMRGRAGIKWVNDIVIDEAKVAGFITHTTSVDGVVTSAVVGIGLNVEATPRITPDRFFHRAASLCDFLDTNSKCGQRTVFALLLERLAGNYDLLRAGRLSQLVDSYRGRSIVIGREVEILPDSPHRPDDLPIRGVVTAIGDNLELYLDGREAPVTRGRLAFVPEAS
jgi:biotin-(acetyl-CoA carboxylase) ligase